MFYDDIYRNINGVIKVEQDQADLIKQEVEEYVITKELRGHFQTFFTTYESSFHQPTHDIGVWISGFFGSGKSHFLKILSYILENKTIDGKTTVERFERKFEDDYKTYEKIKFCTQNPADTILFNIDQQGLIIKDKTAVLRVFAKMFYNHLGFYGDNFKVAKLEQYIEKHGKTQEFREVFEEKYGFSWIESREEFDFCEDEVVESLIEVMGMSETSARNWFNSEDVNNMSIDSLVKEIKEYVDKQDDNYRLVFMVDEVGQYIGGDTSLLLNLQSLVETLGAQCNGKVWVACTGQEAIDEIIKVRNDDFSRIQARFKTRLSLSSASADEVIQKRILKKNDNAESFLEGIYEEKKNEMANLFKFSDSIGDIRGFESKKEFSTNFPFVPYQFILMQKVFTEIRKHGNAGKHLSGGERSMLSGFQEAAQKVGDKDENALVPFYMFYDTVHTFLDGTIRRVIERCQRAIDDKKGLEEGDQKLLKLLYLIRYIDDVPAKLDNLIILMADDIRMDKIEKRTQIQASLDRLIQENYIGKTGDIYNFLTDEEQDVEREIKNEYVEASEVSRAIGEIIFGNIYINRKLRYKKYYDFDFNKKVDDAYFGNANSTLELQILTIATSDLDKEELKLMADSSNKVICLLGESDYYTAIENSLKIRKYARKKNVAQLARSMQDIIRGKQEDAEKYQEDAENYLIEAFKDSTFYIGGRKVPIESGQASEKIDQALTNLVEDIYVELDLIVDHAESDQDIIDILHGKVEDGFLRDFETNKRAADNIENYLKYQNNNYISTSMADIIKRYTDQPYGWREIDIAYVMARLIYEQKVTVKYKGSLVRADDARLVDLLRKKSEVGSTLIQIREKIPADLLNSTKSFLRDFFGTMDIPAKDEDLVRFIIDKFQELQDSYQTIFANYKRRSYPGKKNVEEAIATIDQVLRAQADNIGFLKKLDSMQDDFFDMEEDMEKVESFFASQVGVFDKAYDLEEKLKYEVENLKRDEEANKALNEIRKLVKVETVKEEDYPYYTLPQLNNLMTTVNHGYEKILQESRDELKDIVIDCRSLIHSKDDKNPLVKEIIKEADNYYKKKEEQIQNTWSTSVLNGFEKDLWEKKDYYIQRIDVISNPPQPAEPKVPQSKPSKIKKIRRQLIFPAQSLKTEADINSYLKEIEENLKDQIKNYDELEII